MPEHVRAEMPVLGEKQPRLIPSKEVAGILADIGTHDGNFGIQTLKPGDSLYDEIANAKGGFELVKVSIEELATQDPDFAEYLQAGEIRPFDENNLHVPPIVMRHPKTGRLDLRDGWNRVLQRVQNGETEIEAYVQKENYPNVWQMTKQEFINMDQGAVELLPLSGGKRERGVIHPSPKKEGYIQWSLLELNPITKLWEARSDIQFRDKRELRKRLAEIHRAEIQLAIREGKSVPREVLKDYPAHVR